MIYSAELLDFFDNIFDYFNKDVFNDYRDLNNKEYYILICQLILAHLNNEDNLELDNFIFDFIKSI